MPCAPVATCKPARHTARHTASYFAVNLQLIPCNKVLYFSVLNRFFCCWAVLAHLALQRRSISISLHCRPSPFAALFSSTSSIQRALLHLLLLFDRYTAACVILPIRHPSPSAPARTHAAAAQVIVYSPAPQPPTLYVTFTIQPRRGAASHPRPEEFKR